MESYVSIWLPTVLFFFFFFLALGRLVPEDLEIRQAVCMYICTYEARLKPASRKAILQRFSETPPNLGGANYQGNVNFNRRIYYDDDSMMKICKVQKRVSCSTKLNGLYVVIVFFSLWEDISNHFLLNAARISFNVHSYIHTYIHKGSQEIPGNPSWWIWTLRGKEEPFKRKSCPCFRFLICRLKWAMLSINSKRIGK